MGYDYYTKGKTELKLPFLSKYFFDPFKKSTWPFAYFHQVWSSKFVPVSCFNVYMPLNRSLQTPVKV